MGACALAAAISLSFAGVAGNVLLGGVIGLGVDIATGASQDLVPNNVTIKLEPVEAAAADKAADGK